MLNLMRVLVKRLQATTRSPNDGARPKTFAIVPLQEGLTDAPIAHRLAAALSEMGSRAAVLDASVAEQSADWFNSFEAAHDIVFYRGDGPDTAWTHLCARQADKIFLLARSDRPLPERPPSLPALKERAGSLPELLLLHPSGQAQNLPEHFALRSGIFESHHHVRAGNTTTCRGWRGSSPGARSGWCSPAAARAASPYRRAQGARRSRRAVRSSGRHELGAIIAAGIAAEWSLEELTERVRTAFVDSNPLSDYTFPLIALVRGKKVSNLLRQNFGDMRIEELPKPFFCVSSDLTTGRIHDHRSGALWRALARERGAAGHPAARDPSRPSPRRRRRDEQPSRRRHAPARDRPDHRLRCHRRARPAGQGRPATANARSGSFCGSACAARRRSSRS